MVLDNIKMNIFIIFVTYMRLWAFIIEDMKEHIKNKMTMTILN